MSKFSSPDQVKDACMASVNGDVPFPDFSRQHLSSGHPRSGQEAFEQACEALEGAAQTVVLWKVLIGEALDGQVDASRVFVQNDKGIWTVRDEGQQNLEFGHIRGHFSAIPPSNGEQGSLQASLYKNIKGGNGQIRAVLVLSPQGENPDFEEGVTHARLAAAHDGSYKVQASWCFDHQSGAVIREGLSLARTSEGATGVYRVTTQYPEGLIAKPTAGLGPDMSDLAQVWVSEQGTNRWMAAERLK